MDQSQKRQRRTKIVWIVVVALVGGFVAWSMRPKAVVVEAARIEKSILRVTIDAEAKTRMMDKYVVSAPTSGQLQRIMLRAGDVVKQGALLAEMRPSAPPLLDTRGREQALSNLRAAEDARSQAGVVAKRSEELLEASTREYARGQALMERGVINSEQLDHMRIDWLERKKQYESSMFASRVAGHQYESAKASLGWSEGTRGKPIPITSPVSGYILHVFQESEGMVQAGASLVEIGDPNRIEINADVLTTDAVGIRAGQHATLDGWGASHPLSARVRRVEPAAFTKVSSLGIEEQRVHVVLDLLDPPSAWNALGDGYRVYAHIEVLSRPNVLVLPLGALFRQGDAWAVFTVKGDHAYLQRVEIGARNKSHAEVIKGVVASDSIILHPTDAVTDGVLVAKLSN